MVVKHVLDLVLWLTTFNRYTDSCCYLQRRASSSSCIFADGMHRGECFITALSSAMTGCVLAVK
jgi:hypothetical protein